MEQFIIDLKYVKDDMSIGHVEICSNKEKINDDLVWIAGLYVEDSYRHTGIGTKLMNRVIDLCKKLLIPKVYLYCKPKLITFYEKFGAEDVHKDMNGYKLMELNI